MAKRRWIQGAIKRKGALSRQLGIPEKENIPTTLLNRISKAKVGSTIKNPTKKGRKTYKVTGLLKKRATLAKTLKKMKK